MPQDTRRRGPALRKRSSYSVLKYSRRKRTAHDQGQAEGLRMFQNHNLRTGVLPDLKLFPDNGRTGLQPWVAIVITLKSRANVWRRRSRMRVR